jgi:hypothetical protein
MSTGAGDLDLDRLPPEYRAAFEAQQTRIAALAEANAGLSERNRRLEHLVREFRQALYGKKSEKLDADERQLAFEDLEVAMTEAEAATPSAPSRARAAAGAKRNLGRLPKELPRSEVVIEPDSTLWLPLARHWFERQWRRGCGEVVKIGEDRSERLDIVPAQFRVIATVRPRLMPVPPARAGSSRRRRIRG